MATVAGSRFGVRPRNDRDAFLIFVAAVWIGVLSGFGTDSFHHIAAKGLDYPLIVHMHAVSFVSYLTLFTVQVVLVRNRRVDLHRRLGVAGAVLAGWMLIVGPATAIAVDAAQYASSGETPEFLGVQLTDMLAFAVFTGAGLLRRRDAMAHKRLMLLGLFYISDAGFARFLNGFAAAPLGEGRLGEFVALYLGSDLLILAFGVYDLATRRRLHPAYLAGFGFVIANELLGQSLLHNAAWKAISLKLIGA
jgi:uncharacterized membrane protein YozB (DUF420 family)